MAKGDETIMVSGIVCIALSLFIVADEDNVVLWMLLGMGLLNLYYAIIINRFRSR